MDHPEWQNRQDTIEIGVDGRRFECAYIDAGSGQPVTLFLHGIPTWSFLYRDVIESVEHALVPDLPGYGFTEPVTAGGYDRSVRVMEHAARSLLDALDIESAQVVGHDLGGSAALRLAVHTEMVERLVLSNAGCYDSWPVEFIHEQGLPATARDWTREDVEEKLSYVFSTGTYDEERATDTFVDGMLAPFLDPDTPVTRLARNAVATNTNHTTSLTPYLDEITAPTLLLWGADDVLQPTRWADRLAEDIPTAQPEYLDGAYHWVMQDRPAAYAEAIEEFLE